jgi:hypothetical protein
MMAEGVVVNDGDLITLLQPKILLVAEKVL